VQDSVLGLELIQRSDVWGTIISDKFGYSSIVAKDILENEIHEGDAGLALKHPSFRK